MGCALSVFQHFNGNVSVVFYSNTIFKKAGVVPSTGNAITMTFLLLANFPAIFMLDRFGRRTLLLFWNSVIICLLLVMCLATVNRWPVTLMVSTASFMTCFVFAPGPITWIYMSEVMSYKGVAVATTLNWTCELIIGIISKPMLESEVIGDYVFAIFACTYTFATVVICMNLKETRGKTEDEVQRLYLH